MGGKVKSQEAIAKRAKYSRDYHKRNRTLYSKLERASLLRKHNFSQQGYDALLEKQKGVCPVCKRPLLTTVTRSGDSSAIDHDHACCPKTYSCGKCIRGILHLKCNAALGGLGDNPTNCRNAAEYLDNFTSFSEA